ncbi:hypothetical protein ABZ921_37480 [Streptomyces atriruber]|uniref:Holin n=1 Tax=Streptomyces atriruber TaxID=545121 RepID=A0ABV3BZ92_9ACTN|nr:hypothetical protein [Streptomyces atriruber]
MTDATRRGLRTAVQALFTLIAAVPLLAAAPGIADIPVLAGLVGFATALSRLMAVPAVEALLPPWLRRKGADDGGS